VTPDAVAGKAARILHVAVQPLSVREPDDFATAFSAMTAECPDAIFLVADALTTLNRKRVLEFAATCRIPAMYEFASSVQSGGRMSYGPGADDSFKVAARYLDLDQMRTPGNRDHPLLGRNKDSLELPLDLDSEETCRVPQSGVAQKQLGSEKALGSPVDKRWFCPP
jgi:hypothetical protein